jgi:hypothetical protein
VDKTRIRKAWWRVCVVDKRLTAVENCPHGKKRNQKFEGRYWEGAKERLTDEVSAATGVTDVVAVWCDGVMEMFNGENKLFLRLYTNDPLLVEEVEQKDG